MCSSVCSNTILYSDLKFDSSERSLDGKLTTKDLWSSRKCAAWKLGCFQTHTVSDLQIGKCLFRLWSPGQSIPVHLSLLRSAGCPRSPGNDSAQQCPFQVVPGINRKQLTVPNGTRSLNAPPQYFDVSCLYGYFPLSNSLVRLLFSISIHSSCSWTNIGTSAESYRYF